MLYVINGLGPGGSERSLAELLPFYVESGIRPEIVCLRRKQSSLEAAVCGLGCEVRFLSGSGLVSRTRELGRVIQDERVDLVHTTLFEADLVGRLAAAGTGVPVLTSLVNTTYDQVRLRDPRVRQSRLFLARLLDAWSARHLTSHFHAVAVAVKRSAVEALGISAEDVTVVERGRNRARLGSPSPERRHRARRRLGLCDDHEIVITVGRQEYQKGHRHLFEAVAELKGLHPRLVLLVVGREGHATESLLTLRQELHLEDHVRLLGHREDVPDLLAAADVFAFSSVYEGLPGAIVEAMGLGLPIVASEIPSHRELVEEEGNGILVPVGDATSFAAAIVRILADRTIASTFSARSLEIFSERFTIERSARRMVALYERVVDEGA